MVICPVALAVGCRKCPIFRVCPVKGVIGDYKKPQEGRAEANEPAAKPGKVAAKPRKAAAKPRQSAARARARKR